MESKSGVEVPDPIKVNVVRAQFAVKEDQCLANEIQNHEFSDKYNNNRYNRRTVRSDIPVAQSVQIEEEENLREVQQRQNRCNQEIFLQDQQVAAQILDHDRNNLDKFNRLRESKDAILAQQLLQQDYVHNALQRNRTESNDFEVAQKLQNEEREKYDQRKKYKLLKKEKLRLEELSISLNSSNLQETSEHQRTSDERVLRNNGKFEDVGDFNDFYIQPSRDMKSSARKELQELQDQELARLLQDQERNRGSGARRTKDNVELIQNTDAALAVVMQKQEKLKADKYFAKKQLKKTQASRSTSLPAYPEPPAYNNDNNVNNIATRMSSEDKFDSYPHQSSEATRHQVNPSRHSANESRHSTNESRHSANESRHSANESRHRENPDLRNRILPDPSFTTEEQRHQEQLHRRQSRNIDDKGSSSIYSEPLQVSDHSRSSRSESLSNNVIASIDPTFRRSTITDRYPVDDYANMADMTSSDDVIRGQRRQTKSKDSKDKGNCKQQ